MSDLDFDLNAPAAPSLTLDAAPAAPTLTLDPEADAKVVEEAKKATPVTVEDTPLSPEEQKMVQDFAEKIDLTNSQMILQYGAASQKKLSDFSDSALSRVRTKDMGETGELITQLIGELKGFDATAENQKGFLGFFKKKSNELEALKVKYDKADVNVERIKAQLEDHQVTLMKDIAMLDKMYQLNLVYFKELSMYILAGRKKLQQVRENDLAAAEAKAKASGLPEDAQAARDLADQCRKDPDHHCEHHPLVEEPDGSGLGHGTQPAGHAGRARRDRCHQRAVAQERRNPQAGHHRHRQRV